MHGVTCSMSCLEYALFIRSILSGKHCYLLYAVLDARTSCFAHSKFLGVTEENISLLSLIFPSPLVGYYGMQVTDWLYLRAQKNVYL